jgi:hypothetical protein
MGNLAHPLAHLLQRWNTFKKINYSEVLFRHTVQTKVIRNGSESYA